jgi:phosphoglycerate kinase
MHKQTVRDIDVKGKRVLLRVDYNVPINNGVVGDTLRIEASFETINYLLEQNCSIVMMSHLGRPEGKPDAKYSLEPVASKATELLGHEITFVADCIGATVKAVVDGMTQGDIILLENTRFYAEDEADDPAFAKQLAAWGEVFVDDAFAAIHRAHASTEGVTHFLPSVAGLLVEKEVEHISGAIERPNRPLVAIVGGAKVSSKIEVLEYLIPKVDILMLGGAMANTFYLADGKKVGKSLVEPDQMEEARRLVVLAKSEATEMLLPDAVVVSKSLTEPKSLRSIALDAIQDDDFIVDATESFAGRLYPSVFEFLDFDQQCTVVWNGPIGVTEVPEFSAGSLALAGAIVALPGEISIIGGGDTAAFIDNAGRHDQFTWVSTGGGASLELMSGKKLPGLEALLDK